MEADKEVGVWDILMHIHGLNLTIRVLTLLAYAVPTLGTICVRASPPASNVATMPRVCKA